MLTVSDYLGVGELRDLTGRKQHRAQIDWLRRNRWRHTIGADGKPRVLRAYRDRRLLDQDTEVPEVVAPDFTVLKYNRRPNGPMPNT